MKSMSRRDLCIALSSLAALAARPSESQRVGAPAGGAAGEPVQAKAPAQPAMSEAVLDTPMAYMFNRLPVAKNLNGESRAVVHGVLPTGEAVELHETTLLPGHMPHPPHKHRHSEFMLIREGTVEFDSGGSTQRLGPGGVAFAASNIMHGLKNVGATNANYFVIAIGQES